MVCTNRCWDILFLTFSSRVCLARKGLIRKYNLNVCRRCFRETANDIGFFKVSFRDNILFDSYYFVAPLNPGFCLGVKTCDPSAPLPESRKNKNHKNHALSLFAIGVLFIVVAAAAGKYHLVYIRRNNQTLRSYDENQLRHTQYCDTSTTNTHKRTQRIQLPITHRLRPSCRRACRPARGTAG